MKISMNAEFQFLKNVNGAFVPIDDNEIEDVSIGGYEFVIGGLRVPFDWEAHEGGWDYNGFYSFSTGRGWFFNDFELDTCYDEAYEELGLKREDITAVFLASAQHINDFYVNFVTKDGAECEAGFWKDNAKDDAPYRLALRSVSFEDVETGRIYNMNSAVVNAFNNGDKLRVLPLTEAKRWEAELFDIVSGNNVADSVDSPGYAWGLFENDIMVGYCTLGGAEELGMDGQFDYPGYSAESLLLSDVFVSSERRGRGYAEFMVNEAIRLKTGGKPELVFLTILDDGLAHLYEKCGFEVINEKAGLMVRDVQSKGLENILADAARSCEEMNNHVITMSDVEIEKG